MKQRTKYFIASLFVISLAITGVGFAMAEDSAVGTLEVERDGFYVDDLSIAATVTPDTELQFSFRIYSRGGHDMQSLGPSTGDGLAILVEFWADGETPSGFNGGDGVVSNDQRAQCVRYGTSYSWAYFPDDDSHLHDFSALSLSSEDQTFYGNWSIAKAVWAGTWHFKVTAVADITPDGGDEQEMTFLVNDFLEIELVETDFAFFDGTQGVNSIGLEVPSSGYLTFNVIANFDWKVQLKGTDLINGGSTIPIANVYAGHNGVDYDTLTTAYADISAMPDQTPTLFTAPTDVAPDVVQLWLTVNIPSGATAGSYTFTFSVNVIAA